MRARFQFIVASVVVFCSLSTAHPAAMPVLQESFASPGAASQLRYSKQYGLLFLRNSGSAIRVVDAATHAEIDLHLANQQFTDMDLTPDGKYLYVADWGRVSIGYGTPINQHYVHRYDLENRQWQTMLSNVDTYKLEAVDSNRILLLESDQWVDVNLMQWSSSSSTMVRLGSAAADYYGDIEYDPVYGRIYHGNSGSSSSEINVLRLVGNNLNYAGGTGVYGSAQSGGGTSVLSLDGTRFYFGRLQVEALDVTNNIQMFPQAIYAANHELAFGSSAVYDAMTGATVGAFGYTTTVYGLDQPGYDLWTYYNNTLYHYSIPEPAAALTLTTCVLAAGLGRPRRTVHPTPVGAAATA